MTVSPRASERNLLHRGIGRFEVFDLTPEAMEALDRTRAALAREGRERMSFHAPVIRPPFFPHSAVTHFYVNEDAAKRDLNLKLLADTLERARAWGADYVVTHLTFGGTDTKDATAARRAAEVSCAAIAALSREYAIPVDIEFAAYTDSFNDPREFAAAIEPHPELGFCIDMGHTFVGAEIRSRDYFRDVAALAPRARSLHLWNSRGAAHTRNFPHTPLHPSQDPAEGWIDVERFLATVLAASPVENIVFEYPVEEVTATVQEGYDWVEMLTKGR